MKHLSYEWRHAIAVNIVFILSLVAIGLLIGGGVTFHKNHYEKTIHEQNTCEVMASSYYQATCFGHRHRYVCYRPVWLVTYSIFADGMENWKSATIEHGGGFRTTEAAENKLSQYQVSEPTGLILNEL